jgi:predicted aconitase
MGRELFARFPVFAASISAAEAHLKELGADWGLRGAFSLMVILLK